MVTTDAPAEPPQRDGITWVRPELVAEIEYLQLTDDVRFRAPSFRRLRDDKEPRECILEIVPGS